MISATRRTGGGREEIADLLPKEKAPRVRGFFLGAGERDVAPISSRAAGAAAAP